MNKTDFVEPTPETVAVDGAIPARIAKLPKFGKYPVPCFVGKTDGKYDFRVVRESAFTECHMMQLCWICGEAMGSYKAFVVSPISAINRVSSEPPSHTECAIYAAKTSPFLVSPARVKATGALHLDCNPGVSLVWITKSYNPNKVKGGVLFEMGPYEKFYFLCEGRLATADETIKSIDSSIPTLMARAEKLGEDHVDTLNRLRDRIVTIVLREL